MWISRGPTCDCCFLAYHLPLQRKVWQGCLCRYLSSMSRLLLDYNLTSFWLNRKAQLLTVNPCPLDIHRVPQHLYHLVIWLTFFSLLMVLFVVRNPKLDAVLQMHSLQCLKKIMSVHHPGGYSCYCSICTLGLHFSKATLLTRVQLVVLLPFLQSYFLPSLYCYIAVLNCRCRTFHLPLDFVWFLLGQGPFGEQHCLEEKWSLVLFSTQHHEGSTGQALISVMTAIRPKRIVWSQGNGRWVLGGGSSPEGDCPRLPRAVVTALNCWSSRSGWTALSGIGFEFQVILCGAWHWTRWSFWVPSNSGYSMILALPPTLLSCTNLLTSASYHIVQVHNEDTEQYWLNIDPWGMLLLSECFSLLCSFCLALCYFLPQQYFIVCLPNLHLTNLIIRTLWEALLLKVH